ncbi:endo alpha-1,4 polygalactosaminidase [bacterium]|nr:endo alpha-1,4 polygalactosaminidase [bacterium]
MSFQIQFSGDVDLSISADIFDLDAFDTESSTIEKLHQNGKFVVCYINAGAVEEWRPDASHFPPQLVGKDYQGWPGENWLDIRELDALALILEARLNLCKSKGFDGVEFDNVDGYQNDTGFDLTASDQLVFNRWLADAAHQLGLAVGLKNDPGQIGELEPWFDFLILESCFEQGWCEEAEPFIKAGKPVFAIEYNTIKDHCSAAGDSAITLLQKHLDLNAWRRTCP